MNPLFSITYLPPVSYLLRCIKSDEIILEKHEHFVKQTYRNRCIIAGPNGKQPLIIPVNHKDLFTIPVSEVRISFETPWNKIHWKSLCAAYRNAPYFEFYEEAFKEAYVDPPEKLFDFNLRLFELLLHSFKTKTKISFTETFEKFSSTTEDLRNHFHPKKETTVPEYHQVFSDRNGFLNDVSSIDFLFNAGPS